MTTNAVVAAAEAEQAALAELAKSTALAKERGSVPEQSGGSFLKMGKDGIWVWGRENIEVQPGSHWAIDPFSMMTGLVCWTNHPEGSGKKNTKLGEVLVPAGRHKVVEGEMASHLDDKGNEWPWTAIAQVKLICINGEDEGTEVIYNTSSQGGTALLAEWFAEMSKQIANATPTAIVSLSHSTYNHTQWGKTYKPSFEYEDWRSLSSTKPVAAPDEEPAAQVEDKSEAAAPEPEAEKEAAPARRRRPAATEAEPAAEEAPKPTRRRRPAA